MTWRRTQEKMFDCGRIDGATLDLIRGSFFGTIGVCSGCFDILQSGHAVFFEQCKLNCDRLIVVVGRSSNISGIKPGRPINPDANRLFLVAAIEAVDFATLGDDQYSHGKMDCVGVCDALLPDVMIVNDDDSGLAEKSQFCQQRGIRLVTVSRVVPEFLEPTSTTKILEQVKSKPD